MAAPSVEADVDLYVLLNIPREASPEEIRNAFRRLSKLYHPDKHVDPSAKTAATQTFTKIKEAHEILSDDKLRQVYDEFGLGPAREAASPALELTPFVDLAARFRQEAAGKDGGGRSGPRDAFFTVTNALEARVDGTGIAVALEDGGLHGSAPLAAVTQVSLSSLATAYVAQDTTLIAQFSGTASRARASGPGELTLAVRQTLDAHSSAEAVAHVPLEDVGSPRLSLKVARVLSSIMQLVLETSYDPASTAATTALTASRTFDERHSASLSWATGAEAGVGFHWQRDAYDEFLSDAPARANDGDDNDGDVPPSRLRALFELGELLVAPAGWRASVRMGASPGLHVMLRRPIGSAAPLFRPFSPCGGGGGMSVKLRANVNPFGWEVEAGATERFVANDSMWGMAVSAGSVGVIWKLKLARGGHRLTLPVVLVSTAGDAKAATAAAIVSSLMVTAVEMLIVQPIARARENERKREMRLRRKDELEAAQKAAVAAQALLTQQVATARAAEGAVVVDGREGAGLLVERAVYGVREAVRNVRFGDASFAGREVEEEVTECGDCVQALVEESVVHVVSSTKSTLMGMWDPSALGEKEDLAIKVWYMFRRQMHVCVVDDMEPLELPLSNHKVSSWS